MISKKRVLNAFTVSGSFSISRWLSFLILVVYGALLLLVSLQHEFWYDEAQAWLIAKSVSVPELLLKICRSEGHPPLYYLVLMPLAKSGISALVGLRLVNFLFTMGAVWLILRHSPFPPMVRILLPFTYFMFYQYGVINRTYSLFIFFIVLAALFHEKRNERPFRYIAALILLSLTSAYGLIISFGICLAWTVAIVYRACKAKRFPQLLMDRRMYALLSMVAAALFLVWILFPNEEAFAISNHSLATPGRYLYCFLGVWADASFYDSLGAANLNFHLNYQLILACIMGFLFLVFIMSLLIRCKELIV